MSLLNLYYWFRDWWLAEFRRGQNNAYLRKRGKLK